MEHKNPRTVIDDQNLTLQPPWGLCLKAAGRLRGGTPNRLSQGRVATAGTESPQKVNCHKNNGIWKCVFHAAEGGGVAEDIGQGTSCLVLSQVGVPAALSSPRVLWRGGSSHHMLLHSYDKWLGTLQVGPGSVVPMKQVQVAGISL